MRDRNDEDFLWTHQVERRKRILIEKNPSRAVLGGGIPLGCRADTLNRATQFLEEAGRGKDAAFFVPACARSASAAAAGWKLTRIQPVEEPPAYFFPRDGLDVAGVDVGDTALNFSAPGGFDVWF
jgi:hypothetical protein